jgi:hypothetical protein
MVLKEAVIGGTLIKLFTGTVILVDEYGIIKTVVFSGR